MSFRIYIFLPVAQTAQAVRTRSIDAIVLIHIQKVILHRIRSTNLPVTNIEDETNLLELFNKL